MKWTKDGAQWVSGTYRITGYVMAGGHKNFVARGGDKLLCEVMTLAGAKARCAQIEDKHSRLIVSDLTDG